MQSKKPLQAPYNGPFKMLQRTDKHFTLEISGKKKVVSLDRLKPAYVDTSLVPDTSSQTLTAQSHLLTSTPQPPPPASSPSPTTTTGITRSGRHVYWPKKFTYDSY